jgi:hypothetical protein
VLNLKKQIPIDVITGVNNRLEVMKIILAFDTTIVRTQAAAHFHNLGPCARSFAYDWVMSFITRHMEQCAECRTIN